MARRKIRKNKMTRKKIPRRYREYYMDCDWFKSNSTYMRYIFNYEILEYLYDKDCYMSNDCDRNIVKGTCFCLVPNMNTGNAETGEKTYAISILPVTRKGIYVGGGYGGGVEGSFKDRISLMERAVNTAYDIYASMPETAKAVIANG